MNIPENYGNYTPDALISYIEKLKKDVKETGEIYGNKVISEFSEEDIINLLGRVETIDKSLRSCLKDCDICGDNGAEENGPVPWSDVQIHRYPGAILLLELPPLMLRSYKSGRYSVSTRVERALKRWVDLNISCPASEDNKLIYIYKRYSNKPLSMSCDNDNWEMRRVTNVVSEAIGIPDNPRYASFFYTTVYSEFDGAELMLIRENNLPFFLDYLNSRVPASNKIEE